MLYHDASIVQYHLCRLSVTMNSVCYSPFASSSHPAVIVNTDMSLEASGHGFYVDLMDVCCYYADVYASGDGFYGSVAK